MNAQYAPSGPAREFAILLYHRIVVAEPHGEAAKLACSARMLAAHMAALLDSGYSPVNLDQACAWLKSKDGLPGRPVVITLDDGYRDNCDVALPVLRRFGVPAGVFVATASIGRSSAWTTVRHPMLSWEQMRAMASMGVWFGAHTVNHVRLTQLPPALAGREIIGSRQVLEEQLAMPVHHFAYPYGDHDKRVQASVRAAGFKTGLSTTAGLNRESSDPYALFRVPVSGRTTAAELVQKLGTNHHESSHLK